MLFKRFHIALYQDDKLYFEAGSIDDFQMIQSDSNNLKRLCWQNKHYLNIQNLHYYSIWIISLSDTTTTILEFYYFWFLSISFRYHKTATVSTSPKILQSEYLLYSWNTTALLPICVVFKVFEYQMLQYKFWLVAKFAET